MIHGRRVFHSYPSSFKKRKFRFVHNKFQLKYISFLLATIFLAVAVTVIPIYSYVSSNYHIFIQLAYNTSPELIEHIEREFQWLKIFLASSSIGLLIFCCVIGFRMSSKVIAPLRLLEEHIKKLTNGDWSIPEIHLRNGDYFSSLITTYNYFYHFLKANTQAELDFLSKISIDPNDIAKHAHWQTLLENHASRLSTSKNLKVLPNQHVFKTPHLHEVDQTKKVS